MDLSLLMTDEEYYSVFKNQHSSPYSYNFKKGTQFLFYFGTRHSHNSKDEQWQVLEQFWGGFITGSDVKRILLLEGNPLPTFELSREQTIIQYGEAGFLYSQARSSGIMTVWPELSMVQEARELKKRFEPDSILYFFFARTAGAWLRANSNFYEIIVKAAESTGRRLPNTPTDIAIYSAIHRRIFGRPLIENEKSILQRAAAPVYFDSIINDIARASSRLRNEHIVNEVDKYWREGYSIFLLFGAAHAVMQERVLREMTQAKP